MSAETDLMKSHNNESKTLGGHSFDAEVGSGNPGFTDNRPEAIQMKGLQAAANASQQVQQLMAVQRQVNAGAPSASFQSGPVQAKLDEKLLEGLSEKEVKAAEALDSLVEVVNEGGMDLRGEMFRSFAPSLLEELEVLQKCAYKDRFEETILFAEKTLAGFSKDEKVDLPKNLHSIWVEGDVRENKEAVEGMATRGGGALGEWKHILWVYQRETKEDAGLTEIPVKVGGLDMVQRDFRAYLTSVKAQKEHPWLQQLVPILDILLEKKGYVAMSDLMRMVILYLEGGLYTDVKAQITKPNADFFQNPQTKKDGLDLQNRENWVMVAEAGSKMVEDLLKESLKKLPPTEDLEAMPINYEHGEYRREHRDLHENHSVFTVMDKRRGVPGAFGVVSDELGIENPRPKNSWANARVGEDEFFEKRKKAREEKKKGGKEEA